MKADVTSETITLMHQHRSIRTFTEEAIDPEMLKRLIEAGQTASSSSFIQAYSVIRVGDKNNRKKIAKAAGGQSWVEKAPEFLVYCADLKRIESASINNNLGMLEGYAEHFVAATVDVALMAQNVMLAAESLGLGGVFIGGIRNDPQNVSDYLKLPEHVYPVFGMCLGWPANTPAVKPRFPSSVIMHQEMYNQSTIEKNIKNYDECMMDYYKNRHSNSKISNWSEQTAEAVQLKKRPHLLGFLQQRGLIKR